MNENTKLVIEGYNQEKLILTEKLSTSNSVFISSNIHDRLNEIDEAIKISLK